MSEAVRMGIIHSSSLIREGLKELLSMQPDIAICGTFGGAVEVLGDPPPAGSILLYDFPTARRDGTAVVMDLRGRLPGVKIIQFNVPDDGQGMLECVRVGASGCLEEAISLEELVDAIRGVHAGETVVSPRCVVVLLDQVGKLQAEGSHHPSSPLTSREEQILQLVIEGLSNKEIAQRLLLQPQTVKNYVHIMLQKLALRSRFDVIRRFRRDMSGGLRAAANGPDLTSAVHNLSAHK